ARNRGAPALHALVLPRGAVRDGTEWPEASQEPQSKEAEDRRGLHALADRGPPARPPSLRPAREGRDESVGQHAVDLVEVGLEEVGHLDLAVLDPRLAPDALEAAGPRLQIGDANRILVRHPHREPTRPALGQRGVRIPAPRPGRALASAPGVPPAL